MERLRKSRLLAGLLGLTVWVTGGANFAAAAGPSVTVIHSPEWSQGDLAREGAAEFVVLLEIARLQQSGNRTGVIAVGDRRGMFSPGAEEALRLAVLHGVPVVKLAQGGRVLPVSHGLFLDGGSLSEESAAQTLVRCLERYGALPAGRAPLKTRLQSFQRELTLAASPRLVSR